MSALLVTGADVNSQNRSKETPINLVANSTRDIDKIEANIRMLIDYEADVNIGDFNNHTALTQVGMTQNYSAINALLDAGASLDKIGKHWERDELNAM